jgi:hypothetical protein
VEQLPINRVSSPKQALKCEIQGGDEQKIECEGYLLDDYVAKA